jgi:hypothetical protein
LIANNAEPESLEIELVGDAYVFDKKQIYSKDSINKIFPKIELTKSGKYLKTNVVEDDIVHEYKLVAHQDLLNIDKYGRRLGNIHYTEDK